jgi:hypothetical protein
MPSMDWDTQYSLWPPHWQRGVTLAGRNPWAVYGGTWSEQEERSDAKADLNPKKLGSGLLTAACETSFNSDFLANTKNPRREPRPHKPLLLNRELLNNHDS